MNKNKKFIVFSGGCFSGKTTAMKIAEHTFNNMGINVVMLSEVIREKGLGYPNIDKLRENAKDYLELQSRIINEKIDAELQQYKNDERCVVIVDRAITDSLFYLTFFTDKSKLQKQDLDVFAKVYTSATDWAKFAFTYVYDILLEFNTLPAYMYDCSDRFRPKNLMSINNVECDMIKLLNESYLSSTSSECERITFTEKFETINDIANFFEHIGHKIIENWKNGTRI